MVKKNHSTIFVTLKTALIALGVCLFSANSAKADLNIYFSNNISISGVADSNIWITVYRPNGTLTNPTDYPGITYNNGTALNWGNFTNGSAIGSTLAESIQLSSITNSQGLGIFNWTTNPAVQTSQAGGSINFFVSYGSPMIHGYVNSGPSSTYTDPNYNNVYAPIELTYNGNPADVADLTAINYFSAELSLSTYSSSDVTGQLLQSRGYNAPTAAVLQALTNGFGPSAVGTNPFNTVQVSTTNANNIVRVQGPSGFTPTTFGAYTNFASYLGVLSSNSSLPTLVLSNSSAFNTISVVQSNSTYTNANVTFVMTNAVTGNSTNGYTLTATGTLTVVYTSYTNGVVSGTPLSTPYSGITFTVSPNGNSNVTPGFIYLGSTNSNTTFGSLDSNATWNKFTNDLTPFMVANTGTPSLGTILPQIAGELSTAIDFGIAGSTNLVTLGTYTNVPLGSIPTGSLWTNTATAFGQAQTNSGFYNTYAGAIFDASSNGVYSAPYSDRYSYGPGLNLVSDGTTNVGSLLVGIGAPLNPTFAVPEPSDICLFGLSAVALMMLYRHNRRSNKI